MSPPPPPSSFYFGSVPELQPEYKWNAFCDVVTATVHMAQLYNAFPVVNYENYAQTKEMKQTDTHIGKRWTARFNLNTVSRDPHGLH